MLIKKADDQSAELAELERRISATSPGERKRLEEELRKRRAGIKGEAQSAYLIDFDFVDSKNWAVLHDLWLEHEGQVAQIDHLLINRWMECYVLESKHFHAGVRITEEGEFERWSDYKKTFEGMASPLLQNERHITVLKKVVASLDLPLRLGIRIPLNYQTLILVSPDARISRPKKFDTSRVVKADHLRTTIWKDIDGGTFLNTLTTVVKLVSAETVEQVARQLAARHRPLRTAVEPALHAIAGTTAGQAPAPPPPASEPAHPPELSVPLISRSDKATAPACKHCQSKALKITYGQYGYYYKCSACSGNTAIKLTCQPEHKPKLRKEGERFFRECPQCQSSSLYFENAAKAPG